MASELIYWLLFRLWGSLDYDLLSFISIQFNTSSVNWDEPSNSHGEIKPSSSVSMDINHAGWAFAVLNFLKSKVWKTIYSNYVRYVYNWLGKNVIFHIHQNTLMIGKKYMFLLHRMIFCDHCQGQCQGISKRSKINNGCNHVISY